MAKKVTSIIVIVSLSLSMFFGGLGLTLRFANADTASDGYFDDIIDDLILAAPEQYTADIINFQSYVEPFIDNSDTNKRYWTSIIRKGNDFIITLWKNNDTNFNYNLYGLTDSSGGIYSGVLHRAWPNYSGFQDFSFECIANLYFYNGSYFVVRYNEGNNSTYLYNSNRIWGTSYGTSGDYRAFPNYYDLNDSNTLVYCSRDISIFYQGFGFNFTTNLFSGSIVPPIIDYEIFAFWLGNKRYLTIKDQSLMRQLNGGGQMEYVWSIEGSAANAEEFDFKYYQYDDLILLPYSGVESQLENISPAGTYALDITDLDWWQIYSSDLFDVNDINNVIVVGSCVNCPYVLQEQAPEPGSSGTPDSYSYTWQYFNEYISNYDSTQVIPENLVNIIFGTSGYKIYPCDVSIPSSTIPSGNAFTPNIHTYKWHFTSLPSDLGIDFDLMDVCIIPRSETGNYGLVYFYDDTLAAANKFVDYVDYKDILEQFDIILVVDDELEAIQENAWWQLLVPSSVFASIDYMAVSGSSSYGIEYTTDPLPGNIESGFCIVTKRAIQRMQLYIFNDGISKSYKLMSDFIEKHGLWENSFFEWSQSIFYQLQTIGGKTNDIYNLLVGLNLGDVLDNINRQLERIADNTSEEDPGYWFLSLFNFISRFSVTDLDFANWVDNYDDFESQLPLPNEDVTPIPIPTITSEVG